MVQRHLQSNTVFVIFSWNLITDQDGDRTASEYYPESSYSCYAEYDENKISDVKICHGDVSDRRGTP